MSTLISRLYSWATDKTNGVKITASRVDSEMDQVITALNRKVLCATSAPSNPINGQTWVDTTNNQVKCYLSNTWVIISNTVYIQAGTPDSASEGYLWYDTANNLLKHYDGSNWNTCGDMTHPASTVQGDMLYYTGEKTLARLAKNTNADRVLMNTGSSNNPAWGQVTREAIVEADFSAAARTTSNSAGSNYQATVDSLVTAWGAVGNGNTIILYSDASATPTTEIDKAGCGSGVAGETVNVHGIVLAGQYYKVAVSGGSLSGYVVTPLHG